jgi:hypothetical protein
MVDANPTDRSHAKEIMIAYISALGPAATLLFRKAGREAAIEQNFTETWETILKTVADHG